MKVPKKVTEAYEFVRNEEKNGMRKKQKKAEKINLVAEPPKKK